MSIEATNWALKQRLRLPGEQWLLMLIANAADPTGVAFAWWKGKDHWWTYLVERSRMSKASVFKHLTTLEELGLGQRVRQPTDDGSFRAVMHLDMTKIVDISTDDDTAEPALTDESQSNDKTEAPARQSDGRTETSPTVGPIEDSITQDSNPPNPPAGGGRVSRLSDEEMQAVNAFAAVYPAPVTDLPKFLTVWAVLSEAERSQARTGAKGYADFLAAERKRGKDRAVKDAHRWLAGRMWLGYLAKGEKIAQAAEVRAVPLASPEGRAIVALHRIAGCSPFRFSKAGEECTTAKQAPGVRTLALAEVPPIEQWVTTSDPQQIGAWRNAVQAGIGRMIGGTRSLRVPWPWPPRKDGGTYSASDPPDKLSDSEAEAFTRASGG